MLVARFFNPGQSVMAGLSGGADSVTLLHLLIRLSEEMDLRLTACHINHNLRGQESDSDSAFCDELCDRFEIPLIQVDLEVAALAKAMELPLPARDADGNYPAVEYTRVSLARSIIRDRANAGLNQRELAELAGIRVETLCRIETGKHTPSLATVTKIDQALKRATSRRRKGR